MQPDLLTQDMFPLHLQFKISTLSNDFIAADDDGNVRAYVRQKLFKLKEHVIVYENELKENVLYEIKADKWLDFNTSYSFTDEKGRSFGRVVRKGWKSLWKAYYIIFDHNDQPQLEIREKNAWVKVWDGLLSEVPLLGLVTGYFFNPSYLIQRPAGEVVSILKKEKSFFGRKFTLSRETYFNNGEEELILLSVMMMVLLERRRG